VRGGAHVDGLGRIFAWPGRELSADMREVPSAEPFDARLLASEG